MVSKEHGDYQKSNDSSFVLFVSFVVEKACYPAQ